MYVKNFEKNLLEKIKKRKLSVGIIGLGYVGLPLTILLSKYIYKLYGFDNDKNKIKKLKKNISYLDRIDKRLLKRISKKTVYNHDYSNIKNCDVIIFCVPTPLKNNKPDLSYLKDSIKVIFDNLKKGQVLIIESTSYPRTTREELVDKLKNDFKIGEDIFVGFSPERIDPGNNENSLEKIPKIVSGYSNKCRNIIYQFYKIAFKKVIKASSLEAAEFSKLLENIYRSVNIGFINEMKIVANKFGLDIFDILNLAETKPYGFVRFNPGPGIGGHCIPIDPEFLYWKAKKIGINAEFIKLSAKTNIKIISYIRNLVLKNLNKKKINYSKSKILILGISYKKNIDDLRESSSLKLIKLLNKNGIKSISICDPYIKTNYIKTREFNSKIKNIKLTSSNLSKFDIVILMTDHDIFNYKIIKNNSKFIIDCRGKFKVSDKIIRG
ncbi:nucleotide sugar dehydrogenase [Pelagibacterales bacterium SAG-MED48]|nr:nucleotide sugar dehydrogenase [Pelagibacterales bacterium SAG-MED48]